jgi:tripartite-type tricarboxylate transporter receptor subunit TctC
MMFDTLAALHAPLSDPDVKKNLAGMGIETVTESPQYFADFIQSEMTKWAKVAKATNIHPG